MKKHSRIAVFALCAVLSAALTVPAMAHGRHSNRAAKTTTYPVCTVEDCQRTRAHTHDDVTYCGHTRGDGHAQHDTCAVSGCTNLGTHTHSGCRQGTCRRA